MLPAKPDTSLNWFLGDLLICSIALYGIISNNVHILSSMSMKLLGWLVIFSFNPYIMRNWDCSIEWIPVLIKWLLLIILILRGIWSIRTKFRPNFCKVMIDESWADVKSVIHLILFKRFVFLKSLYLLHVQLVLSHCELGF